MENALTTLAEGRTELIIGTRRTGKTTELVKMSAETGHCMVVSDKNRAAYCMKIAHDLGLSIRNPITFQEFIRGDYYGHGISGFLIDDADTLLRSISKFVPIYAISLTAKVVKVEEIHGP